MSTETGATLSVPYGEILRPLAARVVIGLGLGTTLVMMALAGMQSIGLANTQIGRIMFDLLMYGEQNWDATRDHHGQWGDIAFAIMSAPLFFSWCVALGIEQVSGFFQPSR